MSNVRVCESSGQRSGSRPWVDVKGQGLISGVQRSILGARLSASRSNKSYYQSKVFVCVSVIRVCIQRDNSADVVTQLLIIVGVGGGTSLSVLQWEPLP